MPIEGLPTETTPTTPPATPAATTPDEAAKNTAAAATGTATQAATSEAQPEPEKKFSQADVDRMIQNRLKTAVKAELKKLTGEGDGTPTVEDLQRQLSDMQARTRSYEARESVEAFLTDGRNKLSVPPENVRGIQELVIPRLEYGDDGKPTNLKEAIETAKSLAPVLFTNGTSNINANAGKSSTPIANMNDFIRQSAGYGN